MPIFIYSKVPISLLLLLFTMVVLMIKQLVIVARDSVGLVADISYVLAMEKINIEQISVNVVDEKAVINIGVLGPKYDKAKAALEKNKFEVLPTKTLIVKIEDVAGSLAELTKKLADAKINILSVHVIGKKDAFVFDSIVVDRYKDALRVLGPSVVSEAE